MATKRDLVEAHAFSRRRLVTAFVSGAPGGREVEPVRPGRALVGGVALCVLLVAGALIAASSRRACAADWHEPGLVVSKETGAAYVITERRPGAAPGLNITSALLIPGCRASRRSCRRTSIEEQAIGPTSASSARPRPCPTPAAGGDRLVGLHRDTARHPTYIAPRPQATPATDAGFVVQSGTAG